MDRTPWLADAANGAPFGDPPHGTSASAGLRETEKRDPSTRGIQDWTDEAVLGALLAGQCRALASVEAAVPSLAAAARLAAAKLSRGGRLVYLAAGSPALLALGDALEIPQTFGEPLSRFPTVLAGGDRLVHDFAGGFEDDAAQAETDVRAAAVGAGDCVVAVSASGSTPYTLAGLRASRLAGAATVAIANNAGAPLLEVADVAVLLASGPEIVAGSTRMGAGTAQKAALNMLSTLVGLRLGHVHDGHMVNVRADNAKLRERAVRILRDVTGVDEPVAAAALEESGGAVKPAIVMAAGAPGLAQALALLSDHGGHLPGALFSLQRERRPPAENV